MIILFYYIIHFVHLQECQTVFDLRVLVCLQCTKPNINIARPTSAGFSFRTCMICRKKKLLILFSHFGINSFGCSIQLHNAMYHYSSLSNLMAFFDDFHNDKTINAINAMTVIHFLLVQGEMN